MQAKQRPEFVTVVTALAATFGKEASEAMLTGYWMGLSDLELPAFKRAASMALRDRKFMPTVAELHELAGELTPEARAVVAWDAAILANRLHGYYHSVSFDDPAINATIRSLGGWPALDDRLNAEGDVWLRKDFERIFITFARRGVTADEGAALAGFFDRANGAEHPEATRQPVAIQTTLKPTRMIGGPARPAIAGGQIDRKLLENIGTGGQS